MGRQLYLHSQFCFELLSNSKFSYQILVLISHWYLLQQCAGINAASCKLAHEVAAEGDALVAGGISQTPSYLSGAGKEAVQAQFKIQLDEFVKNKVDFIICEVSYVYSLILLAKHALEPFSSKKTIK